MNTLLQLNPKKRTPTWFLEQLQNNKVLLHVIIRPETRELTCIYSYHLTSAGLIGVYGANPVKKWTSTDKTCFYIDIYSEWFDSYTQAEFLSLAYSINCNGSWFISHDCKNVHGPLELELTELWLESHPENYIDEEIED